MSQEDFNKIIQDKFDSREFEVNEANWNKLLPEIEKQEKKRKRRIILYFLIPGLLFLVSVPFLLDPKENAQVANRSEISDPAYAGKEKTETINTEKQNNNTQQTESSVVNGQSSIASTSSYSSEKN